MAEQGKFVEQQVLSASSICDHNCIYMGKVISRTDKTVTIQVDGKNKQIVWGIDI
jgi:hypothetical protein